MNTPATYTKTGAKSAVAAKMDKEVFGLSDVSHELIKSVYQAYLANGRENLAKTLRRGEVRGGGKKPWKQKGTGRARFGSSRNPIWRKGGIVFGPLGIENYSQKVNIKTKRAALRSALSLKLEAKAIVVIEDFVAKGSKTREAIELLAKINATGNILLVVTDKTSEVKRSVANIQNVLLVNSAYLNVYDAINADTIVMTAAAHQEVETRLSSKGDK